MRTIPHILLWTKPQCFGGFLIISLICRFYPSLCVRTSEGESFGSFDHVRTLMTRTVSIDSAGWNLSPARVLMKDYIVEGVVWFKKIIIRRCEVDFHKTSRHTPIALCLNDYVLCNDGYFIHSFVPIKRSLVCLKLACAQNQRKKYLAMDFVYYHTSPTAWLLGFVATSLSSLDHSIVF